MVLVKLWIFICCTFLAQGQTTEGQKTEENVCFEGEGKKLKEVKVPNPVCRVEIEYGSEKCTPKIVTQYKTAPGLRTDLAMEIVGSQCTYTNTKIDCICVGSGCNEPKSFKKILAKEISKHRSTKRLQKLLCFMTDGDLFANGTVAEVTSGTSTTTEEPEWIATQGKSTKLPPPKKKKTTKAIKKQSKPPKDSKGPVAGGGGMKGSGESDEEFVRNLSLHVVFGLLLLLLIFANIVFFTLVLYYKKKEEDERDKLSPRQASGGKSKSKGKGSAEKSEPGSAPGSAEGLGLGMKPGSAPGSAEGLGLGMKPGFAPGSAEGLGLGMTRHPMYARK
ncbi:hypothetical protein Aduo_016895 [Ancylostoma duodenale]